MIVRHTLLAGAGLGALALCATPSLAKAPVHHKKASSNANSALMAQVKALQEQVADLSARLNVQEAAQRETVANVNNAQVAATSAATQAQQAQTAASAAQTAASDASKAATKAVPAAVKTELATFSNNPPHTEYKISEVELTQYRDAHAPRSFGRFRPRKPAAEI